MSAVYIDYRDGVKYPSSIYAFSPSQKYPEYQFQSVSEEENDIYDMVRNSLYGLGMDRGSYGKKSWNPFKQIINPGDIVLIKPNMVLQSNHNERNGTECLITHPSIVRAIIDYVIIALEGNGSIVIGDAPVQNCDFSRLINENHYCDIVSFYKQNGIKIDIIDLRKNNSSIEFDGESYIDIGKDSAFNNKGKLSPQKRGNMRITGYPVDTIKKMHGIVKHEYSIASIVLKADVIINLPKPKCHKKAGVTISLKNMIGVISDKACLPHHTIGSIEEGGDEYKYKLWTKKIRSCIDEKNDTILDKRGRYSTFLFVLRTIIYQVEKRIRKDSFYEGSWWGNDTIWRTICDVNRIVIYANKEGQLCHSPQRKMFILADMIIAGEGEGPLEPAPKPVGMLISSLNAIALDKTICSIMGFDYEKIPSILHAGDGSRFRLKDSIPEVISNADEFDGKSVSSLRLCGFEFIPASGWKGHIF